MISLADIKNARSRIASRIFDTPVRPSPVFSRRVDAEVWFKLETLQLTGSFKIRGALNKILCLSAEERASGVIAASAGNHAQGVAFAASALGLKSTIVMPESTPQVKIDSTQAYGDHVNIVLRGKTYDEAYLHALALNRQSAQAFIHPFDDDLIIAGQGTIGLELAEQISDLDAVVVPIGGGGLIAGIASALAELKPQIKVYGVQTEAAPAGQQSFAARALQQVPVTRTIAEGIAVERPGTRAFACIEKYVADVVLVSEAAIEQTIGELLETSKMMVEGAAAAGVAAVLGALRPQLCGQRVAVILSGANIDLRILHRVIERALARTHRLIQLRSILPDQPGALVQFLAVIAEHKGNVIRVLHDRVFAGSRIDQANVGVTLEVLNEHHLEVIVQALGKAGYQAQTSESSPEGA